MSSEARTTESESHPGVSRDETSPRVSIVVMPSSDDSHMSRAIRVLGPLAAELDAELVVVATDDASRELRALVAESLGRLVVVSGAFTRPEICDAAMAALRGDIVLFREAATVTEASVPRGLRQRATSTRYAFTERAVALQVQPLADVVMPTAATAGSASSLAYAGTGGRVQLRPDDLAQLAVAG